MEQAVRKRQVRQSLKEYARGIAGGLLFSFPLIFTMEVWWAGFIATPTQLLILVLVVFLLLLGYNRFAGMRADARWSSVVIDSVEEMGIGVVISFLMLLMLNRLRFDVMSMDEVIGKVLLEAVAVSIGVSIGTAQLGAGHDDEEQERDRYNQEQRRQRRNVWEERMSMIVLSLCGSILVGGNVAPTEEVVMLAVEAKPVHILLMAVVSLLLSMIVVFFSDFMNTNTDDAGHLTYGIVFDTCLSYLVALSASAFCLWFFGRFEGVSFYTAFAQCVVLGVLATLGASAGRLLIK